MRESRLEQVAVIKRMPSRAMQEQARKYEEMSDDEYAIYRAESMKRMEAHAPAIRASAARMAAEIMRKTR